MMLKLIEYYKYLTLIQIYINLVMYFFDFAIKNNHINNNHNK